MQKWLRDVNRLPQPHHIFGPAFALGALLRYVIGPPRRVRPDNPFRIRIHQGDIDVFYPQDPPDHLMNRFIQLFQRNRQRRFGDFPQRILYFRIPQQFIMRGPDFFMLRQKFLMRRDQLAGPLFYPSFQIGVDS